MKPTTVELKELIASKLDVTEFLDIIGFTMWELVEVLESEIDQNREALLEACE
jgi:hypothetical protein